MIMNHVEDNSFLQRHEYKNDIIIPNYVFSNVLDYMSNIEFIFLYLLSIHALILPFPVYSLLG
jgi:hypothetical protein